MSFDVGNAAARESQSARYLSYVDALTSKFESLGSAERIFFLSRMESFVGEALSMDSGNFNYHIARSLRFKRGLVFLTLPRRQGFA